MKKTIGADSSIASNTTEGRATLLLGDMGGVTGIVP